MSCWWNHLFHLFRGKPNATSIRIIRGPGLDHIPPPPPSSMAPAKAKWPALRCSSESEVAGGGAFPGKTWWGCHWIQKQKNIVGNPREANLGFFQSLLVVFAGIGNSKLVTLRPNMASHWNKSTGQSISQESRTCVPTNLLDQEPFGFFIKVDPKTNWGGFWGLIKYANISLMAPADGNQQRNHFSCRIILSSEKQYIGNRYIKLLPSTF